MKYPCLKQDAKGAILTLRVQPRSSRNQIVGLYGTALKIKLTSPPVDGAANTLCREYLAKQFGLPKTDVEIISGETSRQKKVLLHGVSFQQAADVLARHLDG